MASEDSLIPNKSYFIRNFLGSDSLHALLVASLEAGHSLYISPHNAVVTGKNLPHPFEATFDPATQSTILRHLLIDVLWEVYRET